MNKHRNINYLRCILTKNDEVLPHSKEDIVVKVKD